MKTVSSVYNTLLISTIYIVQLEGSVGNRFQETHSIYKHEELKIFILIFYIYVFVYYLQKGFTFISLTPLSYLLAKAQQPFSIDVV